MKELKVFLSDFHDEDFHDEVSGIIFKKSPQLEIYSISLEDHQTAGIQAALRKNILIPYDLKTRNFVNGQNIAKEEVKVAEVEVANVEVKEEVKEAAKPAKKAAKRAPKKEETN